MAVEIRLPELGENIESGDVVTVLVSAGDMVEREQALMELETDKASFDVPSPIAGKVLEVLVKDGDKVKVGSVIVKIEEIADDQEAKPEAKTPADRDAGEAAPSPKTVPPAGKEKQKTDDTAKASPAQAPPSGLDSSSASVPAAPSVRRFAREIGVDITRVEGSGPSGRISIEDVKRYAKAVVSRSQEGGGALSVPRPPLPDFSAWGEIERIPMSNVRRTTARHMEYAWQSPHVTQHDKADITALEALRKKYASRAEAAGGKLTVTAILLKVVAEALKRFPRINASIDMDRDEIVIKKYFHIGVAVDTERGLLVPVIRDVDQKSIIQLSIELTQVAEKARNKKIMPDDLQGGTFSITNLGGFGGTYFTPVVNAPEAAILGVSRSAMEPVWRGEKFAPRLMLPLSLSYDHRLVDGAEAIRFLRWIAEALENPLLLALE